MASEPILLFHPASPNRCFRGAKGDEAGGLTLVELLVVISILAALAAFVLPKVALDSDTRRIREATRLTNLLLASARSRAIETGRPAGVMFKRDPSNPGACTTLVEVEVPPLYAGDADGAVMMVQDWTRNPSTDAYYDTNGRVVLKAVVRQGDLSEGLIKFGDWIRFNNQGPWYEVWDDPAKPATGQQFDATNEVLSFTGGTNTGTHLLTLPPPWIDTHLLTLRQVGDPVPDNPWPKWNTALPNQLDQPWSPPLTFQIQRHPVQSMAPPTVLPSGTAVDLTGSGTSGSDFKNFSGDVTVMFSPTGRISRVYWFNGTSWTSPIVSDPLFFLVGKKDAVPGSGMPLSNSRYENGGTAVPEEKWVNFLRLKSRWISISPVSGMVVVTENAATPNYDDFCKLNDPSGQEQKGIDEARTFAKESRSMGGR